MDSLDHNYSVVIYNNNNMVMTVEALIEIKVTAQEPSGDVREHPVVI